MDNESIYLGETLEEPISEYSINNYYIEFHPNYKDEVGYYDMSGRNDFRMFVTKKPNIINRFFVRFIFGWKYYSNVEQDIS